MLTKNEERKATPLWLNIKASAASASRIQVTVSVIILVEKGRHKTGPKGTTPIYCMSNDFFKKS